MRRLGAVLVVLVVVLTLFAAATALAKPHARSMVSGSAWTYWAYDSFTGQDRMTSIQARTLRDGSATGAVRVIKMDDAGTTMIDAAVRDLAIEDGWAYFVLYDSVAGRYMYLVAYDGSSFGDVDVVSGLWLPDYGDPGEQEIRAYFDARWRMDEWLMPVLRGGFVFKQ